MTLPLAVSVSTNVSVDGGGDGEGGGGEGDGGGGLGDGGGGLGDGDGGCDGEGGVEGGEGGEALGQVPEPQLEPYPAEVKAEVPAHAQRMSSWLASERESALCQVETRAEDLGWEAGVWQATAFSVQGRALLQMWGGA